METKLVRWFLWRFLFCSQENIIPHGTGIICLVVAWFQVELGGISKRCVAMFSEILNRISNLAFTFVELLLLHFIYLFLLNKRKNHVIYRPTKATEKNGIE